MKHVMLLTLATFAFAPFAIAAEDEFGAPFTNDTPLALEDKVDTLTIESVPPYLIEPAAGDEDLEAESVGEQDVQKTPGEEVEMPDISSEREAL